MRLSWKTWLLGCLAPWLALSCGQPAPGLPTSLAEYGQLSRSDAQVYTPRVVVLHNLRRVLDADLPADARVRSLEMVVKLGGEDADTQGQLAGVLTDPKTPVELHRAILAFLLARGHPGLGEQVARAVPALQPGSDLRAAALDWLTRQGSPAALPSIMKLWAADASFTGPDESRFRQIVERATGGTWEDGLLSLADTPDFDARADAFLLVSRRLGEEDLRQRVLAMAGRTQDVLAVQAFLRRFEWLPATPAEHAAVLYHYQTNLRNLDAAAAQASAWRNDAGYRFHIRDYPLLIGISADPLRSDVRRAQLVQQVAQAANARRHVPHRPDGKAASEDRFWPKADALSMADLWHLELLGELLDRAATRTAMGEAARKARAGGGAPQAGGIVYRGGQAELDPQAAPADAICRFLCRFNKPDGSPSAGPGERDLADARAGGYRGLVLTSLAEDAYCAHYHTPRGTVISLGVFAMTK